MVLIYRTGWTSYGVVLRSLSWLWDWMYFFHIFHCTVRCFFLFEMQSWILFNDCGRLSGKLSLFKFGSVICRGSRLHNYLMQPFLNNVTIIAMTCSYSIYKWKIKKGDKNLLKIFSGIFPNVPAWNCDGCVVGGWFFKSSIRCR